MKRGTVKFFDSRDHKRFGFIIPENGDGTIFFHLNTGMNVAPRKDGDTEPQLVHGEMIMPKKGDHVVFRSQDANRGPKARVWAFGADWEREQLIAPEKSSEEVVLGFCSVCRKEVALHSTEPRHPDDPLLEEVDFYTVDNHVGRGSFMSDCPGSGRPPSTLIGNDDLGYDEDGSRFENDGEEEERRGHFD